MTLIIGLLIGYFFWKLFAGKHEGDKIERSFRFLIRGYYIHIHHWIWCTLLLMYFFITSYQNYFVFGILIGSIIQGLQYRDRFVVFYKKEKFNTIYSKFK